MTDGVVVTPALIEEVYAQLTERCEAFGEIAQGIQAGSRDIRAALLSLMQQGRAELRYGFGWKKL